MSNCFGVSLSSRLVKTELIGSRLQKQLSSDKALFGTLFMVKTTFSDIRGLSGAWRAWGCSGVSVSVAIFQFKPSLSVVDNGANVSQSTIVGYVAMLPE